MFIQQKNQVIRLGIFIAICCTIFVWFSSVEAENSAVVIDNDASRTLDRDVMLTITAPNGMTEMRVSNDISFSGSPWKAYQKRLSWKLSIGKGQKVVYVQFRDAADHVTEIYNDTIQLYVADQIGGSVDINGTNTKTTSRKVTLKITYSEGVEEMFVSNSPTFVQYESFPPSKEIPWTLSSGSGTKTVYVSLRNVNDDEATFSDTIEYTESPNKLPPATLLQTQNGELYYLGFDDVLHPFLHAAVFHSWYDDIGDIEIRGATALTLRQYQVGKPICIRGGTWLIQFGQYSQIYAAETGCRLFPLRSQVEATILYGKDWKKRVIHLSEFESGAYTIFDRGLDTTAEGTVDKDHDGVDADTESLYGSSDRLPDSDGDGLSDVEEIGVWITNPADTDTNNNGISDLEEVLTLVHTDNTYANAQDVYAYPGGQIIRSQKNGQYYMSYVDGYTYFLARRTSDAPFKTNGFNTRFVIASSPSLPIVPRPKWYIASSSDIMTYPTLLSKFVILYAL